MSQAGSIAWLAAHELRLSWRDGLALMTAGRRRRAINVIIALAVFAVAMHFFANWFVSRYADVNLSADVPALIALTGTLIVSWSLLLSQAMESVTRAFYARSDLELILTSPVSTRKVFAVRMARIAVSTVLLAVLLAAPFVDVLAYRGGVRWLGAFGVVADMGAVATAVALALTIALFRLVGAKRTRLIAQILAAVIGAAFVIALQVAAIFSSGSLSRFAALQSEWVVAHAPGLGTAFWWPARAVLGDPVALIAVMAASAAILIGAIVLFSRRFGDHALAAAGVSSGAVRQRQRSRFRAASQRRALRRKEWMLLRRDPWLVSQTLMQVLYLLPPALLLWITFGDGNEAFVIIIPVIVMAAGQLAGGLAWLTISAEDAPDFVMSAPIAPRSILLAKIEAVIGMVAMIFAPMVLLLALDSVRASVILALGILIASASSTLIQLAFRVQAKRSQFRRRQTSSRIATFAEAFSSISWAAAAAMAADGTWFFLLPAFVALAILGGVRLISPPRD